ncbi:MAG TPA: maleylpyruvate isomerase family mycothiol-dependent enzyme [Nocardioidaceae bacterium]|nr:maleylpyruvate isomerase family mycothiol-dependent enzyme [Nocardioidaceae bacterium]
MNRHLETFNDRAARFSVVVDQVARDQWLAQSPCEKWTAADVVDHVIDTQRDFLARHHIDAGPRPEGSPNIIWNEHLGAVRSAVGDGGVLDTGFDGFFGPTTIGATLADFYGFDMVAHRWDLARAAGSDSEFTSAEMDLMEASIEGFGEHLYAEGICAPAVPAPADASRQERLLARLGRAVP